MNARQTENAGRVEKQNDPSQRAYIAPRLSNIDIMNKCESPLIPGSPRGPSR